MEQKDLMVILVGVVSFHSCNILQCSCFSLTPFCEGRKDDVSYSLNTKCVSNDIHLYTSFYLCLASKRVSGVQHQNQLGLLCVHKPIQWLPSISMCPPPLTINWWPRDQCRNCFLFPVSLRQSVSSTNTTPSSSSG